MSERSFSCRVIAFDVANAVFRISGPEPQRNFSCTGVKLDQQAGRMQFCLLFILYIRGDCDEAKILPEIN